MKLPVLLLYVPVIHQGYLALFERYRRSIRSWYVLDDELVEEQMPIHREIRALNAKVATHLIRSFGWPIEVMRLHRDNINLILGHPLIALRDEVCEGFVMKYLAEAEVQYDTTFLRWDSQTVRSIIPVDDQIEHSSEAADLGWMAQAESLADQSSCWWRHAGVVAVRSGEVIAVGYNRHMPSSYSPYMNGDPRDVIEAGVDNHLASSIHGEQMLLAEACRLGVSLTGSTVYSSVFPCPVCAKLLAYCQIGQLCFRGGSAVLDGLEVLRMAGVKIVQVR